MINISKQIIGSNVFDETFIHLYWNPDLYSLSGKRSYRQDPWLLEATELGLKGHIAWQFLWSFDSIAAEAQVNDGAIGHS